MTRVPFAALVVGFTAVAAALAAFVAPGRLDVVGGAALGTAVAGAFAAVALRILKKHRAAEGIRAPAKLVNAFVGLMLVRMLGYLAFLGGVVALRIAEPVSVCLGLAGGTVVFQAIEVLHLRKMT